MMKYLVSNLWYVQCFGEVYRKSNAEDCTDKVMYRSCMRVSGLCRIASRFEWGLVLSRYPDSIAEDRPNTVLKDFAGDQQGIV
jgi:hypothetical protein